MRMAFILAALISLIACETAAGPMHDASDTLIDALIIGSAEAPDPVLQRVQELERAGRVKAVVVLESFPVQIHLKANQEVIDELNRIPRVAGGLK